MDKKEITDTISVIKDDLDILVEKKNVPEEELKKAKETLCNNIKKYFKETGEIFPEFIEGYYIKRSKEEISVKNNSNQKLVLFPTKGVDLPKKYL